MLSQDADATTPPPSTAQRLAGLWLEIRIIPVLLWSTSAVTLGTAVGWDDGAGFGWWAAAAFIGVLLQGVVAHTVNEIADWRSGTDRHPSPRVLSGGSKVVRAGLLTERDLVRFGITAGVIAVGVGTWVAAQRTWALLVLGGIGVVGALAYTAAPIRLAYRPIAGEFVAFTCVMACVAGGELVQRGSVSAAAALVGAAHGAYCVSMLLLHHELDRSADAAARPPKRTSMVVLGQHGGRYATGWAAAALVAWVACAVAVSPACWLGAGAAAIGLIGQMTVIRSSPASVTRTEAVIIAAGIAGAFITAALMDAALGWLLLAPLVLVPLELVIVNTVLRPSLSFLQD